MSQAKTIQQDSTVTLHFDIRLKDGSIADSTRNMGKPARFTMGDGSFSAKMEAELLGLKAGDKKKIMLLPDDAFGQPHPANVFQMPRKRFAGTDIEKQLEPGLLIAFTQRDGTDRPGLIRSVDEHEVTVDFNHPLAGHVVLLDVEIIQVD